MTIRERLEQQEYLLLAPYASRSAESAGREVSEPSCDLRTDYQRDRDRIIHCKAFRRLKFKTQVFLSPEGDHYRTRLTHTLEVSQVARTIARALRLNEDLTEAIALGHDLGHTPYGHIGERTLNNLLPEGFRHNEQSLRVVEKLEKNGAGLNLTKANHVIMFDRWWNPAVESQAIDRAFRIGQTKDVMVHKFITRSTIEEKIAELIASKEQLARDVISQSGEAWLTEMSNQEILDLVRLEV